ncbi:hypothetical protein J3Q64DRAFT_1827817 [Phycomyces blakesleeanus]|uniref:Metallothionein n=1 Tax=Phycomyces blakesleeanus TaxID=4837 RepID=A0ABR3BEI4_PHYBL
MNSSSNTPDSLNIRIKTFDPNKAQSTSHSQNSDGRDWGISPTYHTPDGDIITTCKHQQQQKQQKQQKQSHENQSGSEQQSSVDSNVNSRLFCTHKSTCECLGSGVGCQCSNTCSC